MNYIELKTNQKNISFPKMFPSYVYAFYTKKGFRTFLNGNQLSAMTVVSIHNEKIIIENTIISVLNTSVELDEIKIVHYNNANLKDHTLYVFSGRIDFTSFPLCCDLEGDIDLTLDTNFVKEDETW